MSMTNSQQDDLAMGSDARPPILYRGNYAQWSSRFTNHIMGNDIYNSIDSNQTSKESWNALKRTQQGADVGVHTQQTLTLWNYQSFKAKLEESIGES
ncbi:hypothetical protein Tco_0505132 [Tanacetum coccineum]